jgi:molecular chaperone GrpE
MADEKTSPPAPDEAPDTNDMTPDDTAPIEAAHELSEADAAPDNGAAGLAGLVPGVADAEPGPGAGGDAAELKEKLLRALADMENLRRRSQREREDATKYAMTNFARDLLTVADNLRRALDSVADEAPAEGSDGLASLTEGVEMTERELMNLFERYDIRRVEPKGEKFDPNFHQAMFEVPDSGQAAGSVVQVMQPGYVIGERLLRPAMVGVAAAASGDEEGDGDGAGQGSRIDTTV